MRMKWLIAAAALAPSGSGRHWPTGMQRYCAYMAPPAPANAALIASMVLLGLAVRTLPFMAVLFGTALIVPNAERSLRAGAKFMR